MGKEAVGQAYINIALIKYWGKQCVDDEDDILPLNNNLSYTLTSPLLMSTTTVKYITDDNSNSSAVHTLTINGKNEVITPRIINLIKECKIASNHSLAIASTNTVPTAAGMASSASGMAALTLALHQLHPEGTPDINSLSRAARRGSGSACRSLMDGFVEWNAVDGGIKQCFGLEWWPSLTCIIAVMDDGEKAVGSTPAMHQSVQTSTLLNQRLATIPAKIESLKLAISSRNFSRFAQIIMQESNEMHAICLNTIPPIKYLTDASYRVMMAIHKLNGQGFGVADNCGDEKTIKGRIVAGYTFDAGPNAFVFCEKSDSGIVKKCLLHITERIIECPPFHS